MGGVSPRLNFGSSLLPPKMACWWNFKRWKIFPSTIVRVLLFIPYSRSPLPERGFARTFRFHPWGDSLAANGVALKPRKARINRSRRALSILQPESCVRALPEISNGRHCSYTRRNSRTSLYVEVCSFSVLAFLLLFAGSSAYAQTYFAKPK